MSDFDLITEDAPVMPTVTRAGNTGERGGQFINLLRPAIDLAAQAEDGKGPQRVTVFPTSLPDGEGTRPFTEDDAAAFKSGMLHSANNNNVGLTGIVKQVVKSDQGWLPSDEGSNWALFWQVRPKFVRAPKEADTLSESGTSTPDMASADGEAQAPSADAAPTGGKAKAKK